METELINIKKNYLRNILNKALKNDKYTSIVFHASFPLDEVKELMEEIRTEYNIETIAYIDFDKNKVKKFFNANPSKQEIEEFTPKYPELKGKVKEISFTNVTDYSKEYFSNYSIEYYRNLMRYNKTAFIAKENEDILITIYPNEEWAYQLLGNKKKIDELWKIINDICIEEEKTKEEFLRRLEIKNILNKMGISNLHFYTDLGTDFTISLNPTSVWCSNPNKITGNLFNYPSYEIFTSPNCKSAKGKIVLSQKSRLYKGIVINNASFEFSHGLVVNCESDNNVLKKYIMEPSNNLKRIGEIALVSQDSPLSKTRRFYDSVLLDENTGCHFALGNSIDECIAMSERDIRRKEIFDYYTSDLHTDFVFGNDSVCVEADTKDSKKVLIMENGKWKI